MWWLLIPVIGAVVAAVASSDSEKTEAVERRALDQAREAEAQAIARRNQVTLDKRKAQLISDVEAELNDLFATHPAILGRTEDGELHVSFDSLRAFAAKKVPSTPLSMLEHLETIAPGAAFSPVWTKQSDQAHALQEEISGLHRLKQEFLG